MITSNKDVVLGDVDLAEDEFTPRHVKVRVTTMIDKDVLGALKKLAKQNKVKYQTLLNSVLRRFVEQKTTRSGQLSESRVREIVREEIRKRA